MVVALTANVATLDSNQCEPSFVCNYVYSSRKRDIYFPRRYANMCSQTLYSLPMFKTCMYINYNIMVIQSVYRCMHACTGNIYGEYTL